MLEEFEINKFDLIDIACTLIATRKSGKTYLLTDLLFKTIMRLDRPEEIDIINVIIFCQSLIDSNLYFILYIMYTLLERGYDIYYNSDKFYDLVVNFKLKDYIQKKYIPSLVRSSSDYIIKIVLNTFIDSLIKNGHATKRTYEVKYKRTSFFFSGVVNQSLVKKISTSQLNSQKNRKFVIIIDDINSDSFALIKNDMIALYEQGRHHDASTIIIDQFIKSGKVPPKIRSIGSHLILRSFDETIKKEIMEIGCYTKSEMDIETIKTLISNYYCIIIDLNNKDKLYYYKSPDTIKNIFLQFKINKI